MISLLTIDEVAQRLHCSARTIKRRGITYITVSIDARALREVPIALAWFLVAGQRSDVLSHTTIRHANLR